MTLPVETLDALFVADERIGNAILRPATLAHLVAMDALLGIGIGGLILRKDALLAAWILTLDYPGCVRAVRDDKWTLAAFKEWVAKCGCTADECFLSANAILANATSTYVPGAGGESGEAVYSTPHGFGYPLEIAEFLCHEYGWDFARALDEPLVRIYGLVNCARQRNGGKNGDFDYFERILQRQFSDAKAAAEKTKAEEDVEATTVGDGDGK